MYNNKNALTRVHAFYPNVTRVIDATTPLHITVSKRDVSGATPKKPEDCAMARACKRLRHADGAIIRPSRAYIIRGNTAIRYAVPPSVGREIVVFDRHSDFKPGDYHLSAITKSKRLGRRQGSDSPKRNASSRSKPKIFRHRTVGIR